MPLVDFYEHFGFHPKAPLSTIAGSLKDEHRALADDASPRAEAQRLVIREALRTIGKDATTRREYDAKLAALQEKERPENSPLTATALAEVLSRAVVKRPAEAPRPRQGPDPILLAFNPFYATTVAADGFFASAEKIMPLPWLGIARAVTARTLETMEAGFGHSRDMSSGITERVSVNMLRAAQGFMFPLATPGGPQKAAPGAKSAMESGLR